MSSSSTSADDRMSEEGMSEEAMSDETLSDDAPVALRFDHFAAGYGSTFVVENVSGELVAGGALALIGPNGAGKTTLIRSCLGLVPSTKGAIEVLGTTPRRARRRVAYVPQAESLDADFPVSAFDVALMGRYRSAGWLRRPSKDDRSKAMEALERVDLADRARMRFGTLSGGQRQRVLIARAIAQGARLLLLDEPFNGVDTTTTDVVLDVLQQLRAEGVAIVMSTHDLSIAHLACNEACLISHHQFGFGPIGEVLTPERLRETYGGKTVSLAGETSLLAP